MGTSFFVTGCAPSNYLGKQDTYIESYAAFTLSSFGERPLIPADDGDPPYSIYRATRDKWWGDGLQEIIRFESRGENFEFWLKRDQDVFDTDVMSYCQWHGTLSPEQWDSFIISVHASEFWITPSDSQFRAQEELLSDDVFSRADGWDLIIEGVESFRYHSVHQWSPDAGAVHDLANKMFDIAEELLANAPMQCIGF
ncbi:MAG: hypothetical protein AAGA84_11900 [Pseudomonadota bacterium]